VEGTQQNRYKRPRSLDGHGDTIAVTCDRNNTWKKVERWWEFRPR